MTGKAEGTVSQDDFFVLEPYFDHGRMMGWRASYKGISGHGSTRQVAIFSLKRHLEEAHVPLPVADGKQIRLGVTGVGTRKPAWAAEHLPYGAIGDTKEEAVAALRELCALLGVECPEKVYDVTGTIALRMN